MTAQVCSSAVAREIGDEVLLSAWEADRAAVIGEVVEKALPQAEAGGDQE